MLPREDDAKKYLQRHYAVEFKQMSELLDLATNIVSGTMKGTKGKGLKCDRDTHVARSLRQSLQAVPLDSGAL